VNLSVLPVVAPQNWIPAIKIKLWFKIFSRDFNFLGEDKLIFPIDIISLYAVISNGEGLLALKHFFDLCTYKEANLVPKEHYSVWLN